MFCFNQVMIGTSKNIWGFDPRSVPGCSLWLDGADPAGTGIPPSAGTLTTWVDKSGNGRNGVQYSSLARPTFVTNSLNSRGGVSFSAASSNCYQTATILPTPRALFVVGFSSNDGFILSGIPTPNSGHPPYYATFARDVEFGVNNTSDTAHSANVASTSNVNYILTGLYTGSNVTATMNGGTLSNTVAFSGTPKTPATTLIGINSYAGTLGAPLSGTINEFIAFNVDLTTAQRQIIEGYLAHKWGLTAYYSPTSPLSIPGCQLWLDGADQSSMTFSGSTITQWNDKSANGNNATIAAGKIGATFSSVSNSVYFQASNVGYQTSYSANPTNETMFVVFNNPSPSLNNNILIGGQQGARSLGAGYSGSGGNTVGVVGNLNNEVAWLARTAGGTYTSGTTVLVTSQFTTSTNTISLNGGTAASGGAPGFYANTTTYLGVDTTTTAYYYIGYAMEIIFYNSILNTTQRQQIEEYLSKKWGLTTVYLTLPIRHPYYSLKPCLRVFQPTDIAGCRLWLDAADNSTLTLQSNNKVSAWRDKSSNAFVLSNATTLTQPTYVTSGWNGSYPAVKVNGSGEGQHNFLSNAAFNGFNTAAWDIYAVVKHSATTNQAGIMWIDPSGSFIVISAGIGNGQVYTTLSNGNWVLNPNTGPPTTQNPYIFQNYSTGTTIGRRLNGVQPGLTEQVVSYTGTARSGTYSLFLANPSTGWSAPTTYFAEMLMFSRSLSNSERLQIEGYLSTKWGLTQTSFSSTAFTPTSIGGCQLWFDASDTSSLTPSSITTGTKVSQWNDKSTNNRHMSNSTSASQPTYSTSNFNGSLPCVFFTGSTQAGSNANILSNAASTVLNSTTWDIYVAFKPTGGMEAIFWNDPTSAVVLICGNTRVYEANYSIHYGGWRLSPPDGGCRANECQIFQAYSTGTTVGKRVNGGLEGGTTQTATYSWPSRSSNSQLSFCRPSSGQWSEGNLAIAEVIVYNSVLSDANRSNVETYLTNKWKIGRGLQLEHPFYSFPSSTVTRPNFKELAYTGNDYNAYFAKYSPDGSVLWALRWTATGGIGFQDSATDSNGNVYVTGLYVNSSLLMYDTNGLLVRTLSNSGGYDGFTAKYTSSGTLLWTARHVGPGTNYPVGVAVDSSGNVYSGGTWDGASLTLFSAGEASSNTFGTTGGQTDGYIVKYNSSGIVQWSAKIVCSSYDSGGMSLKTDSSGNVYSVGINVLAAPTFYNANGTVGGSLLWGGTSEGMWLAKWNSSGTFQWALRFVTGDLNTGAGALSIDSSGNLYVSSAYDSTLTLKNTGDATAATMTNSGSYDAFIVKYSSAGSYIWNARIGGTGSTQEIANAIDGSGNVYVMGLYTGTLIVYTSGEASNTTLTNSGSYDHFIAKYTSAGVLVWATRIGSSGSEYNKGISVDLAGNVYTHGGHSATVTFFNVGGGIGGTLSNVGVDGYLAKYTTNGTFVWAALFGGPVTELSMRSITDPEGNIYLGGIYNSSPLTLNGV